MSRLGVMVPLKKPAARYTDPWSLLNPLINGVEETWDQLLGSNTYWHSFTVRAIDPRPELTNKEE